MNEVKSVAPHTKALMLKKLPLSAKRALSLWRENRKIVSFNHRINMTKHKVVIGKNGKPKALIAKSAFPDQLGKDVLWAYYPRPNDLPLFSNASNYVKAHGPASIAPGAVGSIRVLTHLKHWTIAWAQAHFHTNKDGGVKRSLATEYGGWRIRLFTEILSEAKQANAKVTLKSSNLNPSVIADFKKAALLAEMPLKTIEKNGDEPYLEIAGFD